MGYGVAFILMGLVVAKAITNLASLGKAKVIGIDPAAGRQIEGGGAKQPTPAARQAGSPPSTPRRKSSPGPGGF